MPKLQSRAQASPHLQEAHEREQAFLERARAGEDVRNEVALHMQHALYSLARRIHWRYSQQQGNVIEVSDLVHEASVEILTCFTFALTKEEPFPYLYRLAYFTMIDCVNARGRTVKTHPDNGDVPILSLDKPLSPGGDSLADLLPEKRIGEKKYLSVHKALETLPEKQRLVHSQER
jgi:DNA-directed RNA polymerase specialized sigma24 family protein